MEIVELNGKKVAIDLKRFRNKLRVLSHAFFLQRGLEIIKETMQRLNMFHTSITTPDQPHAFSIFRSVFNDIKLGLINESMVESMLNAQGNPPTFTHPQDPLTEDRLFSNIRRAGHSVLLPKITVERKATLQYAADGYPFIAHTPQDPHMVNYLAARIKGYSLLDKKNRQLHENMGRDITISSILLSTQRIIEGMKTYLEGYFGA